MPPAALPATFSPTTTTVASGRLARVMLAIRKPSVTAPASITTTSADSPPATSAARCGGTLAATPMPFPSSRNRTSFRYRWSVDARTTAPRLAPSRSVTASGAASSAARAAQATRSPSARPRGSHSPACSSTTSRAPRHDAVPNGPRSGTILTTIWSASRKTTSIGKRMNAVWIDQAGRRRTPWPAGRSRLPSSPRSRRPVESATVTDSATTRPSSRRSVRFGTGRTQLALAEHVHDRDHHRQEQHDEERGHDQEEDREEDLDRGLLGPLLDSGPLTLPQLERQVAHDLAGRDAHRLALGDRAREQANARRVYPGQQVLERLDECQAHVLLLQGEPDLGGERLADLRGREAERLREAETGLERHDQ